MADIRIYQLPDATTWDGYISQDKSGGTTQRVSVAQVETKLVSDGFAKTDQIPDASSTAPADLAASAGIGASNDFARADHVHKKPEVPWDDVSSKPASTVALGALTPAADKIPYFTNGTTASLATITAAARALLDDANPGAMRNTLECLARDNPSGSGTLSIDGVATNTLLVAGVAVSSIPRMDGTHNMVASGITDSGTGQIGFDRQIKVMLPGSDTLGEGAGIELNGGAGSPSWSAQLGAAGTWDWRYYNGSSWSSKLMQILTDGSIRSAPLASTGSRPISADSTGKLVSTVKPDYFHGSWATGSSTLQDMTNWEDPLVDEAHYRCFAAGKHISATATETRFRFIIGGVSSSTYTVYGKGDWTVNFDVTTIGGAGASVCANFCVYGNNAAAVCVELTSLSYISASGIRLQIASDDDDADMRGLCTRLERLQ